MALTTRELQQIRSNLSNQINTLEENRLLLKKEVSTACKKKKHIAADDFGVLNWMNQAISNMVREIDYLSKKIAKLVELQKAVKTEYNEQVSVGRTQTEVPQESQLDGIYDSAESPYTNDLSTINRPHNHYFRPCPYEYIDVYRIIDIFEVTHPCAQHVLKKAMVTGRRGHKSVSRDIQDMIDTLTRWKAMRSEDGNE